MRKKEIASVLKGLRNAANMKRQDVADALGVSVKTIGHWETGYAQPDADTLFRLCDMYGTTVDSAFGFKKSEEVFELGGHISASNIIDTQMKDAILKCIDLPDSDKEMVISFIDRLYESMVKEE